MEVEKIGFIYDKKLLAHKSKRKHPQKPGRIKVIVDLLSQKYFLNHPRVDYINKITFDVTDQILKLVHKEKYIKHIKNLWPKTSHRTSITILDSYFNQQTEQCSRIAVGGVLLGIQNIISNKWSSGFAAVRPPGHHSGARNTINGFCVYNNVAIAAKYLCQNYQLQRVAIVDWDVHHGDGTQHIFKNNKNVLLISIHRYDRGTFYPASEQGTVHYQGEGDGKGFSVNINLDFVDKKYQQYSFQSPGDNQYIYIYHRIVQPILKAFNPQFILVSSGFDAARGDPIGGFTVTPNGYYYMTKRLLQFQKHLLIVLQGGYNLTSNGQSAWAIMKALLKEQSLPQQIQINQNQMKNLCSINQVIHNQIDQIIEVLSENWPCLLEQIHKNYTQIIKNNQMKKFGIVNQQSSSSSSQSQQISQKAQSKQKFRKQKVNSKSLQKCIKKSRQKKNKSVLSDKQEDFSVTNQFYFAAGHMQRFKNFSPQNPKIYKLAHKEQIQFYENMTVQIPFTCKFFGKQKNYIVLENLLYEQHEPVVIDIKISRQSKNPTLSQQRQQKQKKKQLKSTSAQYGFRISGYTTPNYKQGGLMVKDQKLVKNILSYVVNEENRNQFCKFLTDLVEAMKDIHKKYFGTSIILIKGQNKSSIRWIDFHYWMQNTNEPDHDLIQGVKNLCNFIKKLSLSEQQKSKQK